MHADAGKGVGHRGQRADDVVFAARPRAAPRRCPCRSTRPPAPWATGGFASHGFQMIVVRCERMPNPHIAAIAWLRFGDGIAHQIAISHYHNAVQHRARTRVLRGLLQAMGWMADRVGRALAHYLEKPVLGYEPFTPSDPEALRATLEPGDVLLVEGNNHISGVIKYLTQSTWSHAALYVGPIGDRTTADGEPLVLVEANIGQGVVAAPLSKYYALPHPHLPPDRADRRRPRPRLRLRGRAHRLRLRSQEHPRSDALSVSAAGAAALAPAHDGARLRASDAHHLLGADRAGLRERALSDPAEGDAAGKRAGARRKFSKSAIPRSMRRATSTSRPISQWSSRPSSAASTTRPWPGPTCRHRGSRRGGAAAAGSNRRRSTPA